MQRYFGKIEGLQDIGDVLWYAVGVCEDLGVIRQSYHFTPLFEDPTSARTVVHAVGFDREWLKCYDESDFRRKDPIPARIMGHGSMMTWQEAMKLGPNTAENEEYFVAMKRFGLVHGFGVPLFGPRGRSAYASFDFGHPISEESEATLGTIRSVSQAAHQRVCVLLDEHEGTVDLSQREQEVLEWIVKGKSVSAIAGILELSPDTVKTYAKRIYAKLDTTDRVGAVVRALKLGLVNV
ncbi:helix-turn-helix transcriptional regulator [Erythrobacter rubeus]|uniref:Autoinducer binding domain-containing protein n=1 Tax=Erythrobacter rubeus TaxID=2760803 RepID=A0ABR8KRK5_9SPHN|nr:LuxR family transcriptional regulator [Erythrobacter rubeus]MBD2841858.1 autoinducer binding domain-containing protein [Erythrobacter rubeus]